MKSLHERQSDLANSAAQIRELNERTSTLRELPKFAAKLQASNLWPLKPTQLEILQINVGKLCNQVCKHCHVDAGPDRTRENMDRATFEACLEALRKNPSFKTVDLTGGAPEMNPNFRWFVEEVRNLDRKVIVRCNLTIILANAQYHDLPEFFARNQVNVVSSMPYYDKNHVDRQRGNGVFDKSIRALTMLNAVGYGREGSGLELDLVYNPVGAFLPASQKQLEGDFKRELKKHFNIEFNKLYAITNLPISRYLEYLIDSDNLDGYMEKLVNAYNPTAAAGVMCRNTLSIGWDGAVYDCDFNQMLELKVAVPNARHIRDFDLQALSQRAIVVNQHCYGCTAGQGSSCGGSLS